VVPFVPRAQALEYRHSLLRRRLVHHHGLEPPLQRGVLRDVPLVVLDRGGADDLQPSTGQRGLEDVRRVHHRPFGAARSDHGVQLVDQQHDHPVGRGDLVDDALQPVLELPAVLRARHHGRQVDGDQATGAERGRHVAGRDPRRDAFDDRGLAHARVADQDGVVLGAARQHLDDLVDHVVPTHYRIQLPVPGGGRQVAPEALRPAGLRAGEPETGEQPAYEILQRIGPEPEEVVSHRPPPPLRGQRHRQFSSPGRPGAR
jgi:hypothetical protein